MPAISVSDYASNANDQLDFAARTLRRAPRLQELFRLVSTGKRRVKTVADLASAMKLEEKRLLGLGKYLVNKQLIDQEKVNGRVAYAKVDRFAHQRDRILRLARDRTELGRLATKTRPATRAAVTKLIIRLPSTEVHAELVTIDDIESFAKVRAVSASSLDPRSVSESSFKNGVKFVIGESGRFADWAGERNDLFTTRVRLGSRRRAAALAFKGPATTGKLTLAKLGRHANQVLRLFQTSADLFVVQYCGQIDEDVVAEMRTHARVKSAEERRPIWFGVVDGDDTARLMKAYPRQFAGARARREVSR